MEDTPHRRRPRYPGRNPRRFDEKYKELDPDRFPETVAKVVSSGRTPAGSHRPILVEEILGALVPAPGRVAVDATLGHGGHAAELLPRLLPGGRLIGLDADPLELPKAEARLRGLGFGDEVLTVRRSSFAGLPKVLGGLGLGDVDIVLADLGVSSMQLDDPARGFTFKADGPLDMRMNPSRGLSAADLLARISRDRLATLLRENSDEPYADEIANALAAARADAPITTTLALAATVRGALAALPARIREEAGDDPVRRTFQALRIEVNDELGALRSFLASLPSCVAPGGRVAILTFHSGEDRLVKKAFQAGSREGIWANWSREPVRPGPEELRSNPRSRPAKLRTALRAGAAGGRAS
ncbi:MAG: 16S rRNA (cytosine(1402)-N(4))-methyltransferase RsmH [Holophagales bacterium]|nr:16S rRNA (cytosine(1402)-N(4))-methyltransferase RsmH [Holophagales bacterium]